LLPNFFLLGPPKAGTTAFAEALGRHPEVFMSTPKEPNYFLYAGGNPYNLPLDRAVPNYQDYLRLFAGADGTRVRGDASPYYIYAPHCALEIQRTVPDAKLMVILRNPVERALSAYRYWYKDRRDFHFSPEDFRESFLNRSLLTDHGQGQAGKLSMEWLQDMGRYADMIERYDRYFSPDQIMLIRYDDLEAEPAGSMERVLKFLGVDPGLAPEIRRTNVTFEPSWRTLNHWLNWDVHNPARLFLVACLRNSRLAASLREGLNRANRRAVPTRDRPLPASIYNELIQVYADDLRRLAKRANLDLSDWLRPRSEEAGLGQSLRARGVTALSGATPPFSAPGAPAPAFPRFATVNRWWSRNAGRLAVRVGAPIGLVASALAYWLWPADLIPDATKFGRIDDLVCITVLCLVAGRLSGYRSAR
jgi:hypothetical protein